MATESCWDRGCAALVSAAHAIPYACPCLFGENGRYELVELEAMTAKSWVYRAKDHKLRCDEESPQVAIKISRLQGDVQEAYLGRKVEHDGVVRVLDVGRTPEGFGFLVMDWVDGGDLASGDVPWSSRDAASFVAKLSRTVQAAHGVLVIHCDLKPSNVLLTREREPRLADFDLAHRAGTEPAARKGTLGYMAPEQYLGLPHSHGVQADVYALGGILHFLVIGNAPHGEVAEIIKARLKAGTVPSCQGVEKALAKVIQRALSPDLDIRYATAHALATDLEHWLGHRPLSAENPSILRRARLWSRRHPAKAVAVAGCVLGTCVALAARSEWVKREKAREGQVATKVEQKVGSVKEGLRSMVGQFGRRLTVEKHNQMNNEELLASLAIMQWLDFGETAAPPSATGSLREYGVDTWTEILVRCEGRGASGDLLALYAHVNLARLALAAGDLAVAERHVACAEKGWTNKLSENDTTAVAVRAIRAIVDAGLRPDSGTSKAEALLTLHEEAKAVGIGDSLLRQLEAAAKGASSGGRIAKQPK